MTLKSFLIGMIASFGLAWIFIIAVPTAKLTSLEAVKMNGEEDAPYYQHNYAGRVDNGSEVYAANGCYTCHTQVIRPTYLGKQVWRKDAAGVKNDDGDTRRETSFYDYSGEKFAHIGLTRMGPDLMNVGYRAETYAASYTKATGEKMTAEQWLYAHLFNPRNNDICRGNSGQKDERKWSNCPSQRHLFDSASSELGDKPADKAKALVSYLLSMKHDDAMPAAYDYSKKEEAAAAEKK